MKKLLGLSLVLLVSLSTWSKPLRANAEQLFQVDGIHYHILSDASYEVEVIYTDYNKTTNYQGLEEITIPSYVTYADHVYTVTAIGQYAFCKCTTLEEVNLPSTIRTISESAFYNTRLESIVIPRGVETIGMAALSNCSSLVQVVLPSTLLSMDNSVFYGSKAIRAVTCYATLPPAASAMTFNTTMLNSGILYVPEAALDAYRSHAQWKRFANILAVSEPEQEPVIDPKPGDNTDNGEEQPGGDNNDQEDNRQPWQPAEDPIESATDGYPCPDAADGFCGDNLQWSLSADHTVLTITGSGAMYNYYSDKCVPWHDVRGQIQQVVLPADITYIGHHAFFGCVQLRTISSLDGVRVGTLAFGKCHRLVK